MFDERIFLFKNCILELYSSQGYDTLMSIHMYDIIISLLSIVGVNWEQIYSGWCFTSNITTETRRKAILEAALKSFSTKGFTETTMEDIKRLSGASTGSIYHHFENKEMLAQAFI